MQQISKDGELKKLSYEKSRYLATIINKYIVSYDLTFVSIGSFQHTPSIFFQSLQIVGEKGPPTNPILLNPLKNPFTKQKAKFSINNFFSKYDRIDSFLPIWSHLLKKFLMENFCAVFINRLSTLYSLLLAKVQ